MLGLGSCGGTGVHIPDEDQSATIGGGIDPAAMIPSEHRDPDEKMKENITVVENAVDKVQQLRGVEFTWKKNGEKSAGVIAQDVEKVLPQAVKEKDIMGEGEVVKTVNYDTMSALFIEAIKEQQEQIEALKAEIKALKG